MITFMWHVISFGSPTSMSNRLITVHGIVQGNSRASRRRGAAHQRSMPPTLEVIPEMDLPQSASMQRAGPVLMSRYNGGNS